MINRFEYKQGELYAENVSLADIAKQFGTPCYVYSHAALVDNWRAFDDAFGNRPHQICYAVKSNSNLAILKLFADLQSGFDIVSGGELERVLTAGGDPNKVVFSGVGKSADEIKRALEVGIFCFNVESESELERINQIAAQLNQTAAVSLRINPNIDAETHPYIATGLADNKFGLELGKIPAICERIKKLTHLKLIGIACHIGSQLTEMQPFIDALDCLVQLVHEFKANDIELQHLDIGGGLGIRYRDETPPSITEYIETLCKKTAGLPQEIIIEPGRVITANAGILLTRVEYLKNGSHKNFAIVDAAMNDLIRPALYDAWQDIIPVKQRQGAATDIYDIVGPVCESADFLGKERQLALQENDLLAICHAGSYGFAMSSNYNTRPRAAEVMVNADKATLIRKRETIDDLIAPEKL